MDQDYYAEYAAVQQTHWWFRGRRAIVERVLQSTLGAPGAAPREILDVGCGTGAMLPLLGRFGTARGVDTEPVAIELARAAGASRVEVFEAPGLPFDAERFDVVCAFDVIEHIDDDVAALREMARVACRGGLVVLTVPAFPFLWGPQDIVSHHHRRYTRSSLRASIAGAGLRLERLTFFNTLLFPPIAAVRVLRPAGEPGAATSDFSLTLPPRVNDALASVFAAEARLVAGRGLPFGVSLLATARV